MPTTTGSMKTLGGNVLRARAFPATAFAPLGAASAASNRTRRHVVTAASPTMGSGGGPRRRASATATPHGAVPYGPRRPPPAGTNPPVSATTDPRKTAFEVVRPVTRWLARTLFQPFLVPKKRRTPPSPPTPQQLSNHSPPTHPCSIRRPATENFEGGADSAFTAETQQKAHADALRPSLPLDQYMIERFRVAMDMRNAGLLQENEYRRKNDGIPCDHSFHRDGRPQKLNTNCYRIFWEYLWPEFVSKRLVVEWKKVRQEFETGSVLMFLKLIESEKERRLNYREVFSHRPGPISSEILEKQDCGLFQSVHDWKTIRAGDMLVWGRPMWEGKKWRGVKDGVVLSEYDQLSWVAAECSRLGGCDTIIQNSPGSLGHMVLCLEDVKVDETDPADASLLVGEMCRNGLSERPLQLRWDDADGVLRTVNGRRIVSIARFKEGLVAHDSMPRTFDDLLPGPKPNSA